MKKVLLIVLGIAFASSLFAQKLETEYVDVNIQFENLASSVSNCAFVINANFGQVSSISPVIDADWFFENPNATRNLIGQVEWIDKDRKVFAVQRFYKRDVNYFDLPDYGSFKQVKIVLGRLEYLNVVGPVE